MLSGDELESLAPAKIDQVSPGGSLLHEEIGAKLLLQSGSDRGKRRDPMWLIGLGVVGALEPIAKEGILCWQRAAKRRGNKHGQKLRFVGHKFVAPCPRSADSAALECNSHAQLALLQIARAQDSSAVPGIRPRGVPGD